MTDDTTRAAQLLKSHRESIPGVAREVLEEDQLRHGSHPVAQLLRGVWPQRPRLSKC